MNDQPPKSSKPSPVTSKRGEMREAARRLRQAALLRENLLKRKAQMRERANAEKDEPNP
ncbi:MAG: hypothetical protein O2912_03965 [Proteobacteria bacterium]|nr:hypothetical protein [Pseudomonadota bacterium]